MLKRILSRKAPRLGPSQETGHLCAQLDMSSGVAGIDVLLLSESILEAWPLEHWATGYKNYVTGR